MEALLAPVTPPCPCPPTQAGELSSDDDWYLLDSGLAVLQTTNQVLDRRLLALLSPQVRCDWLGGGAVREGVHGQGRDAVCREDWDRC